MKLLKSLEELLYELVSWLIFYPLTMWRAVTRPLVMMRYADMELSDKPEDQYDDTLSPPLFLLITLLIAQGLTAAIPSVVDASLTPKALSSGSNMLIARGVIYGVFPLVMAVTMLRYKSVKLTRNTLRPPFFSQCYVVAPFALAVGLSFDLMLIPHEQGAAAGIVMLLVTIGWYTQAEVRWLRHDLSIGTWLALALFVRGFVIACLIYLALGLVIVLALKNWSA